MSGELTQKQREKLVQRFHKAEQAAKTKFYTENEFLALEKVTLSSMQEGTRQMKRLGIQMMGSDVATIDTDELQEVQIPAMQDSIAKKESQRKKKKEQEKDAFARAQKSGISYEPMSRYQVQTSLTHLEEHPAEETMENFQQIETQLNGQEFVPDPETGDINLTAVMIQHRKLKLAVEGYRLAKKQGQDFERADEAKMLANEKIFLTLDDALKSWCGAAGMDIDTGKTLSKSKTADAQKHMALAIEKYQETMAQGNDLIGNAYLEQIQKDRIPLHQVYRTRRWENNVAENRRQLNLARNISQSDRELVELIRGRISTHADFYQKNKKKVDQVYAEFLAVSEQMNTRAQELEEWMNIIRNGVPSNEFDLGTPARMAYQVLEKQYGDVAQYRQTQDLCLHAINVLLGGTVENAVQAVYLEKKWGIRTEMRDTMNEEEKEADKEEVRLRGVLKQLHTEEMQRAESNHQAALNEINERIEELKRNGQEDDPEMNILAKKKKRLLLPTNGDFLDKIEALEGYTDECFEAHDRTWEVLDEMHTTADGRQVQFPRNHVYLKAAWMTMPLGRHHEASVENMREDCLKYFLLANGAHLTGEEATEAEMAEVYQEERAMLRNEIAQMEQYVEGRMRVFNDSGVSSKELIEHYGDLYHVKQKISALALVASTMMKHQQFYRLNMDEREEMLDLWAYFTGTRDYVRSIETLIKGRTNEINGKYKGYSPAYEMTQRESIASAKIRRQNGEM